MDKNKILGVIFDVDGMLINGDRFSERLSKEFNITIYTTKTFFSGNFQECLIGKLDLRQELERIVSSWGWKKSIDELLFFWFDENSNKIDERFFPIIELLKQKNIKVYLATNNEKYRTENLIAERSLGESFDGVFSSCYIGAKKPSNEFFQSILDKSGLSKDQLVFWDNDAENIKRAKSFGLPSEQYTSFEGFRSKISNLI